MTINLDEVTIYSAKVHENLIAYLNKIFTYKNFDGNQMVQVYVDRNKDFTAFESIKYNLGFTSSAHKMIDTIKSPYILVPVKMIEFYEHIRTLMPLEYER